MISPDGEAAYGHIVQLDKYLMCAVVSAISATKSRFITATVPVQSLMTALSNPTTSTTHKRCV